MRQTLHAAALSELCLQEVLADRHTCQRETLGDRWAKRADKLYERVARKGSQRLWRNRKWIRTATYRRTRIEADDPDYASMGISLQQIMALEERVALRGRQGRVAGTHNR